jgi:hypothetical protein
VKSEHAEREDAVAAGRRDRARKTEGNTAEDHRRGLLTVRSTVILLAGMLVGGIVSALMILAGKHPAEAAAAGVLALGGAIAGLHQLIE